jgi:hypothetical protein
MRYLGMLFLVLFFGIMAVGWNTEYKAHQATKVKLEKVLHQSEACAETLRYCQFRYEAQRELNRAIIKAIKGDRR